MRSTIALIVTLACCALGGLLFWTLGKPTSNAAVETPAVETAVRETGAVTAPATLEAPEQRPELPTAIDGGERTRIEPVAEASKAAPVPQGAIIAGRLVDAEGRGIAGAKITGGLGDFGFVEFEFEGGPRGPTRPEATSDAEGRFELAGLSPGSARVNASASGYAPLRKTGVGVPKSGKVDLGELTMDLGVVLEGRVVDSRGVGVAGAQIRRGNDDGMFYFDAGLDGSTRVPPLAVTGADGSFRVEPLASGPWRLRIVSDDHPDKNEKGVTQRPGEVQRGLNFVLEDGFEIAGVVSGVPPASLSSTRVYASAAGEGTGEFAYFGDEEVEIGGSQRIAKLADDGSFRLRGLRQGNYRVQARVRDSGPDAFWPRAASDRVEAKTGDRGVRIPWQPPASLAFQAVDAKTGQPVETLRAFAKAGAGPMPFGPQAERMRKYPEGRVTVDNLRPRRDTDTATLNIEATGYRPYEMAGVAMRRGEQSDLGVIELEPMPTVTVRVVDATTRAPLAKARVELREVTEESGTADAMFVRARAAIDIEEDEGGIVFGSEQGKTARTDEQGIARLNSLEGKRGKLNVSLGGFAPFDGEAFEMPAGSDVEQLVALDQGGSVLITLLSAEGAPVSGARVEHRAPNAPGGMAMGFGQPKGAATDALGQVRVENLTPGRHHFRPAKSPGEMEGGFVFAMDAAGGEPKGEGWVGVDVVRGVETPVVLNEPARRRVHGVVREGGVPLTGASLSLSKSSGSGGIEGMADTPFGGGPRAKTDGQGRYKFDRVEVGSYDLVVRHAGRAMPARFPLAVDDNDVEFDVALLVSIVEGRVVDVEGKPVAGARVVAQRDVRRGGGNREMRIVSVMGSGPDDGEGVVYDSAGAMGSAAVTDEEGRYSLRGVESDTDLVVRVTAKEAQPKASEPFQVAPGGTRSGVDVTVAPAGKLLVKVVAADGSKGGPCLVQAEPAAGGDQKTEFNQTGSVTFSGLAPGVWKVRTTSFGNFGGGGEEPPSSEWREIAVVARETVEVELPVP